MPETTLAEAEATALEAAALHAGLANGTDASLWQRLWRLFFLAAAGLFGARQGAEWGVSHYRLKPV